LVYLVFTSDAILCSSKFYDRRSNVMGLGFTIVWSYALTESATDWWVGLLTSDAIFKPRVVGLFMYDPFPNLMSGAL
jgi:hypothetical protein